MSAVLDETKRSVLSHPPHTSIWQDWLVEHEKYKLLLHLSMSHLQSTSQSNKKKKKIEENWRKRQCIKIKTEFSKDCTTIMGFFHAVICVNKYLLFTFSSRNSTNSKKTSLLIHDSFSKLLILLTKPQTEMHFPLIHSAAFYLP